jgi:hypothetical protein
MNYIEKFQKELQVHNAKGYHHVKGTIDINSIKNYGLNLPIEYIDFLSQVGFGDFFSGNLCLYDISEESIKAGKDFWRAVDKDCSDFFIIGNNGTTEGFYCIDASGKIYWVFCHDGEAKQLAKSFSEWINKRCDELFSKKKYSSYDTIKKKNMEEITNVLEERKRVKLTLLRYDKQLVKEPWNEGVLLPRYNKLVFRIEGSKGTKLEYYTVKCFRKGSKYGDDNVAYISIPISGEDGEITVYLFDPFNVGFDEILVDCSYNIDLSSKMKSQYKEIKQYI